jgi:hypothetical protein
MITKKLPNFCVDWGKNIGTLTEWSSKNSKTLSLTDFLNLPNILPSGSIIVGENTHFGCPKQKLSHSQPFTAEVLNTFHKQFKENKITFLLFPEKLTPTARQYSKIEVKSDRNDTLAILNYINSGRCVTSFRKPVEDFGKENFQVTEGNHYTAELNMYLNYARRFNYMADDDCISKWIREVVHEAINYLSPEAQEIFGIGKNSRYKKDNIKKGIKKGDVNFNKIKMCQIYPIAAVFKTYEGKIRKRFSTKKLAGWYFIQRYVFHFSPWHLRGGVARSNFFHHGIENYTIAKLKIDGFDTSQKSRGEFSDEEDILYRKYRQDYIRCIKQLFVFFKTKITEEL